MIWFIILALLVLFLFLWLRYRKVPKCGNMVLITGGIKTGKTTLSVHMVYRKWRSQVLKTHIQNFFGRVFRKMRLGKFKTWKPKDIPVIYSNIPLKVPYVPMTEDLLLRKERFIYGSVVYLCEASLVADSMAYKDDYVNEQLLLFNKLFAHETKGGYLFYDTQSISDNHYAIRRCLSTYFYIHHTTKIPFFCLMWVRELKFNEDGSQVNVYEEDVEESLKLVIVPKRRWKLFDCYCYSCFTDALPVNAQKVNATDLKANKIVSFKKFKNLYGGNNNP